MSFRNGTGSAFTFESMSAELLDISGPGIERGAIDVSHMGTTDAHEYIGKMLADWGEVKLELAFDGELPTAMSQTTASDATIKWGTGSGAKTWSFHALMTKFEPKAPFEDRMTASMTLKISGKATSA
jgi:hypothetical protein